MAKIRTLTGDERFITLAVTGTPAPSTYGEVVGKPNEGTDARLIVSFREKEIYNTAIKLQGYQETLDIPLSTISAKAGMGGDVVARIVLDDGTVLATKSISIAANNTLLKIGIIL